MPKRRSRSCPAARFHVGDRVGGKYRSATWTGRITGIIKCGAKASTVEYSIKPDPGSRHKGEPANIHRYGNKIHKVK